MLAKVTNEINTYVLVIVHGVMGIHSIVVVVPLDEYTVDFACLKKLPPSRNASIGFWPWGC